ncbi:TetR/AcrR family transcriptional regulator [Streptomyces sp. NPDC048514]|uniref:TetR/AcrR family transcriptional regulator n=1 Tax=Streptomyces sp. NPDC048514 TaxID=3365564 RepID=UPI003719DE97
MGHREDLLEGAKRCLLEKGFARTTARDVVKESGTNLASIGYHYGSKDALLAQAYVSLVEGMSEAFTGEANAGLTAAPGSLERFQEMWSNIIATMREPGSFWRLSAEIVAVGDQLPEARDHLAKAQREGSRAFVALMADVSEDEVTEDAVDTLGAFYTVMMSGLISQWSFAPGTAPGAEQLTEGLRRLIQGAAKS